MTRRDRRLWIILACGVGVRATALALVSFKSNLVFFVAPPELVAQMSRQGQVLEWMVAHYGNSARLSAPFDVETALLWSAPAASSSSSGGN